MQTLHVPTFLTWLCRHYFMTIALMLTFVQHRYFTFPTSTLYKATNPSSSLVLPFFFSISTFPHFWIPPSPPVVPPALGWGYGVWRWVGRAAGEQRQCTRGHEHRWTWPDEGERTLAATSLEIIVDNQQGDAPSFNCVFLLLMNS